MVTFAALRALFIGPVTYYDIIPYDTAHLHVFAVIGKVRMAWANFVKYDLTMMLFFFNSDQSPMSCTDDSPPPKKAQARMYA